MPDRTATATSSADGSNSRRPALTEAVLHADQPTSFGGGMHGGMSLYLDVIRFGAAVEVFLFHLAIIARFAWHPTFLSFGHEAVVVFFVLSGYVISYAAASRDRTLQRFTANRLIRVYSVSIPALLLTVILEHWGVPLDPSIYQGLAPLDFPKIRFVISLFLLNETWVSVEALSNAVVWSLCYEVAYYAIFASCFFLTGRKRLWALAACLLFAGPRSLLLFPVWLMGSLAFFEKRSCNWSRYVHWALFLLPLPGFWLYMAVPLSGITVKLAVDGLGWTNAWHDLGNSRHMLSDYYLGIVLMLHFLGAKNLGPVLLALLGSVAPLVRMLASYTFTLYMIHVPVTFFASALFGIEQPWSPAVIIFTVALATALVGYFSEHQRYRLKRPLERLIATIARRFAPTAPATALTPDPGGVDA